MDFSITSPLRENISSRVQASIREALMSAHFRPGEKLNIRSMAKMLGTSATPIREALAHLAAEGAIEMRPGYSARVPLFSLEKYQELCAIRKAVEGLAAEVAAKRIVESEVTELHRTLGSFRLACRDLEPVIALDYSRRFRFGVYRAANMPLLIRTIESLWLQCAPMFRLAPPIEDKQLAETYERVIAALSARDSLKARTEIEKSIDLGYVRLLQHIETAADAAPAA
ncbi:MAG TPA: GntR family transcriptional regulator [Thermomicrobiales bacterium]|nr:GntR family transcriptional regulator [Thermomicrobiales bacterium]